METNKPETYEIVTERVLNFPRRLVFRAWSEPAHLKTWWGPAGFTNTFHGFDFRPGSTWRLTMHGPGKGNYENESVFEKIIVPELIEWNRRTQPLFRVSASFIEEGTGTRLRFRMIFETAEGRDKLVRFAPQANEENFDRLEEELARMQNHQPNE